MLVFQDEVGDEAAIAGEVKVPHPAFGVGDVIWAAVPRRQLEHADGFGDQRQRFIGKRTNLGTDPRVRDDTVGH